MRCGIHDGGCRTSTLRPPILDHCRHYHGGPLGAHATFADLVPYLPRVFAKIAGNLECYLSELEYGKVQLPGQVRYVMPPAGASSARWSPGSHVTVPLKLKLKLTAIAEQTIVAKQKPFFAHQLQPSAPQFDSVN